MILRAGIRRARQSRLLSTASSRKSGGAALSQRELNAAWDGPRSGEEAQRQGEAQPAWEPKYERRNDRGGGKLMPPSYYFRYQIFDLHRSNPTEWTERKLSERFRMPVVEIKALIKLLEYEDEVMQRDFDRGDAEQVEMHDAALRDIDAHRSGSLMKRDRIRQPLKSKPIEEHDHRGGVLNPIYSVLDEDDTTPEFKGERRMRTPEARHEDFQPPPPEAKPAPKGWEITDARRLNNRIGKAGVKGRSKVRMRRKKAIARDALEELKSQAA